MTKEAGVVVLPMIIFTDLILQPGEAGEPICGPGCQGFSDLVTKVEDGVLLAFCWKPGKKGINAPVGKPMPGCFTPMSKQ